MTQAVATSAVTPFRVIKGAGDTAAGPMWDMPVPLGAPHGTPPPFPIDVFPAWLADMVAGVARFTQTDLAMVGPTAPPAAPQWVKPTTTGGRGIPYPERLLTALLDAIEHAQVGRRRTTLYGSARGVARMVAAGAITTTDAITALTDAGRRAEQTNRDITAAISGAFRDEGVPA